MVTRAVGRRDVDRAERVAELVDGDQLDVLVDVDARRPGSTTSARTASTFETTDAAPEIVTVGGIDRRPCPSVSPSGAGPMDDLDRDAGPRHESVELDRGEAAAR